MILFGKCTEVCASNKNFIFVEIEINLDRKNMNYT